MGAVLICRDELVKSPYYIESMGIRLYSMEELAFFLYENIYLVDDNIDLTLKYIRQYYAENAEAVFVKTIGNVDVYQIIDDSVKKE